MPLVVITDCDHGTIAPEEAVLRAGTVRFRPILLTSATTFIGLAPLMATADISTMMFVPLAISLAFGVLLATVVTLLLVPALYLILEDFLGWTRARRTRRVPCGTADRAS